MYKISILRSHFRHVEDWQPATSRHCWRFYYNSTPGAKVDNIELGPDKMVCIPPTFKVDQQQLDHFDQFYIHFIAEFPFDQYNQLIVIEPPEYIKEWINEMIFERKCNQETAKIPLDQSICMKQLNLITFMLSHMDLESMQYKDARISEAVNFIKIHFAETINNDDLAKMLKMSVNGFSRLFKEETGLSPHQFLIKVRMTQAADLLLNLELGIDAISEQCGFCDRAHFSRLFTKEFHTSPVKYRKEILS